MALSGHEDFIPFIKMRILFNGEPQAEAKYGNACGLPLNYRHGRLELKKILFNQRTVAFEIGRRHVGHFAQIVIAANFDAGFLMRIRLKLLSLVVIHRAALQLKTSRDDSDSPSAYAGILQHRYRFAATCCRIGSRIASGNIPFRSSAPSSSCLASTPC